jgi:N-acetylglutamate synthase-like GNAT family acetyltransferase
MSSMTPFTPNDVPAIVPTPRCEVTVRQAVADDLPFIDMLQKMHSHMVGWASTKQIQANIEDGHIVIAEDQAGTPIGYCTSRDQYMKRDDVGIIYQLNVLPLKQRHLVGATLVKAVFDRAAYGCRLFCCWCAQDIQANWFWESIGFIPLAFRTGSRAKQRIHIFWQRRIREGDEQTPYWFPSQTTGGAVAEDRIVLPIPPDTHWRDAKPLVLPGLPERQVEPAPELPKLLPGGAPVRPRPEQPPGAGAKVTKAHRAAIARSKSKHLGGVAAGKAAVITSRGVKYIERADAPAEEELEPPKPKKPKKPRQKNDPKYVAVARELRDRYLEQVNSPGSGMLLPPAAHGKYDVSRQLEAAPTRLQTDRLLDAA